MSEPLAESLSRFTPNATELNRDALLFAAGRASVRPSRRWQALAGTLAVAQLLTLVCLWPRTSPPAAMPFAASGPSHSDPVPMPTEPNPSQWHKLHQRMLDRDLDSSSPPSEEPMAPPEPPLRAFGNPPPYLLN